MNRGTVYFDDETIVKLKESVAASVGVTVEEIEHRMECIAAERGLDAKDGWCYLAEKLGLPTSTTH